MDLLTGHTQKRRDFRDAREPEIHQRRLGTTYLAPHGMGNVRHPLPDQPNGGTTTMQDSSGTSGTITAPSHPAATAEPDEVVELHWMLEPDATMAAHGGVFVPALCGEWMSADGELADNITSGRTQVRYVSCTACDLIHANTLDSTR